GGRFRLSVPHRPHPAPLRPLPGAGPVTSGTASLERTDAFVRRQPPVAVRRRRRLIPLADHSLLIWSGIIRLTPVVFILLTSLMTSHQALSPKLWPDPFAWSNYVDV